MTIFRGEVVCAADEKEKILYADLGKIFFMCVLLFIDKFMYCYLFILIFHMELCCDISDI